MLAHCISSLPMISICITCTLCLLLLSLYFSPIFLSIFFSYIFQSTNSPSSWICCYIYWLSPLPSKEIKQVNFTGNQPWIFIRSTEDEAPIFWPPHVKRWPTGKDPDAGKDWGQEEKRVTEDEIVGWHHWFNGHEGKQAPGKSEGQGSLTCCGLLGHREVDTTEWLNSNNKTVNSILKYFTF